MTLAYSNFGTYPMGGYTPQQQYYTPAPQPQQTASSPIWVQGEAGAKAYPVAPGNSVLLMDSERNVFYIKSADQSGMPMMRTFDYTERTAVQNPPVQAAQMPQGDYVTRSEFDALCHRIDDLMRPAPTTITEEEM